MSDCFPSLKELEARNLLGHFGVQGSMATQPLSSLSGGQRVRVALAKLNTEKPQLLILDEPTNHLDIYSVDALTEALEHYQGSVVLVTHCRSMLQNVAGKVIVVKQGTCSESMLMGQSPATWLLQAVFGRQSSQRSTGFGGLGDAEKFSGPNCKDQSHRCQGHAKLQGVPLGQAAMVMPKKTAKTSKTVSHSIISALDKPCKLSELLPALQACGLSSQQHLQLLAQELCERVARAQQREVAIFADLCLELNAWCVKKKIGNEPEKSFKRELLEACQAKFGRCLDEKHTQKNALQHCTRLMGCLIARGLVARPVIFPVAEELLCHASSEGLESLVTFLWEVLPTFDQSSWKHHDQLLEVFEQIRVLAGDASQSASIRRQLQDLLDQQCKSS